MTSAALPAISVQAVVVLSQILESLVGQRIVLVLPQEVLTVLVKVLVPLLRILASLQTILRNPKKSCNYLSFMII
jgi:hypothetical protein